MRLTNIQLSMLLRNLNLSKDRIQTRIAKLKWELQDICNSEGGTSEMRRKQAFRSVLIAERRFDQLCKEIANVEQQRDSNEDIGTLIQIQSATNDAMTELQASTPEIFAADGTGSIREVCNAAAAGRCGGSHVVQTAQLGHKVQQFRSAMEVAREMHSDTMEIDEEEIDARVADFERHYQSQRVLDMAANVPESRVRNIGIRAATAATTTLQASSAPAASSPPPPQPSPPPPPPNRADDDDDHNEPATDQKHI